jgi:hypothetical protein
MHSGYAILKSATWNVTFFSKLVEAVTIRLRNADSSQVIVWRIVFLHHFMKKTKKTPPEEFDIARKRVKELKHG